jgi:hypothetical protein
MLAFVLAFTLAFAPVCAFDGREGKGGLFLLRPVFGGMYR